MCIVRLGLIAGLAVLLAVAPCRVAEARQSLFDATIADVNGDLILQSDILWNLALVPAVAPAEFWDPAVQRLMLRTLIDQRILIQEAAKLPATRVTDEEIAAARGELGQVFNTPDDSTRFERRQRLVGLSGPRLEGILRERQQILKFVDFRFRSFVLNPAKSCFNSKRIPVKYARVSSCLYCSASLRLARNSREPVHTESSAEAASS